MSTSDVTDAISRDSATVHAIGLLCFRVCQIVMLIMDTKISSVYFILYYVLLFYF
jgi:hypothetical protein